MRESSAPSFLPAAEECGARDDLSAARSFTLIVHGVGPATSEALLCAASDGYLKSELRGVSARVALPECPALTGRKGVDSLVIHASGGSHFVVALPWAGRRTRLSIVAKWAAGLLLALTVAMSVAFWLRRPLEWLEPWLRSWTHQLLAYGVLTAFSFVVYVLKSNWSDREFKRPSMGYLFLPLLLQAGLTFFVGLDELFWIPVALLVCALLSMATRIVLRCVAIAPTVGWKIALVALAVSITLPSAAVIRIAHHRAVYTEKLYPSPDSPLAHVDLLPPDTSDSLPQMLVDTKSQKGPGGGKSDSAGRPSYVSTISPTGDRSQKSVVDLRAQEDAIHRELNSAGSSQGGLSRQKLPNIVDLVTPRGFGARVVLAGICVLLCGAVMAFHWILDFAFDVLHYGGNEKHRTGLIEALKESIRWLHAQAPDASIVVVGHSLGSVPAAGAIAGLAACESWLHQVVLVTLGSPLNYICRAFPKSVPPARTLADVISAADVRWINLWCSNDQIGKQLDIGNRGTFQNCVAKGGHMGYWSKKEVWLEVAFRALGIGAGPSEKPIGGNSSSIFERHLGLLVFGSIVALSASGVGLWLLPL